MPDYTELIQILKKSAVEAVKAEQPAAVCFGKIVSVSPLQVLVEQKILLTKQQLLIAQSALDRELCVTIDCTTENSTVGTIHMHQIAGDKTVTVHSALKLNDTLLLLRKQGGQIYVIIDKVVNI